MNKRGFGLVLMLTFAFVVAAAVQDFRFDLTIARERAAAENIDRAIGTIDVALANLRAAQAGYVAAGQGPDFWMKRASDLADEIDGRITGLQAATRSDDARSHYDAAAAALTSLTDVDRRAREKVNGGERLLASDAIFMDSIEASRRLGAELLGARDAERAACDDRVTALRRLRLAVNGGALAMVMGVALLLYRRVPTARAVTAPPAAEPVVAPRLADPIPIAALSPAPTLNLTDAADICVDLARVLDGRDVPPLLERAAHVIDAKGLILWVTDSAGAVLRPSLAHGYSDKVLQRLGSLQVDADNVTSLAFRSMRPQVVNGRSFGASGAIAVPLITPNGCVGVLAAEVIHARPGNDALSVAQMFAAQLAAVVTPYVDTPEQKTAQA